MASFVKTHSGHYLRCESVAAIVCDAISFDDDLGSITEVSAKALTIGGIIVLESVRVETQWAEITKERLATEWIEKLFGAKVF